MLALFLILLLLIAAESSRECIRKLPNNTQDYYYRVIGGVRTTIQNHPYHVSLEMQYMHFCSGALIRANMVLTAAQCMDHPIDSYIVRVGSTVAEDDGQIAKIVAYRNHPKYKGEEDYDISVLKLDCYFDLNPKVKLIHLHPPGIRIPRKEVATTTGWANSTFKNEDVKYLLKFKLPRADNGYCKMNYLFFNITNRMICYGYPPGMKTVCQGNLGAPLVLRSQLIGITTVGTRCLHPLLPGVFIRINNVEIHKHIIDSLSTLSKIKDVTEPEFNT